MHAGTIEYNGNSTYMFVPNIMHRTDTHTHVNVNEKYGFDGKIALYFRILYGSVYVWRVRHRYACIHYLAVKNRFLFLSRLRYRLAYRIWNQVRLCNGCERACMYLCVYVFVWNACICVCVYAPLSHTNAPSLSLCFCVHTRARVCEAVCVCV